jgi:predicted aminopeptidase
MLKKVLIAISVLIASFTIMHWELLTYGIAQARGQIKIIAASRDIDLVLSDTDFPDSLKQKILVVNEIKAFSVDSIGLIESDNYSTFYDQGGKTSLWNLSACEAYSFTPKTWSFPFMGSFPYKGFFDLAKAKKERDFLLIEGYDTRIRSVGAWSTLGWFSDPILSNMLQRSEGNLADLIIHELTHSTLFVKDNIEFNENLASFIGEKGAIKFLSSKYGSDSFEVNDYMMKNQDGITFIQHMLRATNLLDSLYNSFLLEDSDSIKESQKNYFIKKIVDSMDTITFYNDRYYQIFDNAMPNNAYFMSYLRYHSSEDSLQNILMKEYKGDLKLFISGMKSYHQN